MKGQILTLSALDTLPKEVIGVLEKKGSKTVYVGGTENRAFFSYDLNRIVNKRETIGFSLSSITDHFARTGSYVWTPR
jgi:hypothetical protein